MYRMRLFATRQSRQLEWLYCKFEGLLVTLHPLLSKIGYQRLEKPASLIERTVKGLVFDCQMCGQCVLSSTGMSCPMNCPKQLRNGPCGGVRPDGFCEVKADMRCVWAEAWDGASRMKTGARIQTVLPPVDRRLQGTSSWLRAVRQKTTNRKPQDVIARAFSTEPSANGDTHP